MGRKKENLVVSYLEPTSFCLTLQVDSSYLNRIHANLNCMTTVAGKELSCHILHISPSVSNHTFSVTFLCKDPKINGRNGADVLLDLILRERENVLLVPSGSIFKNEAGEDCVMKKTGEGYEIVQVSTGITNGWQTEIVEGLHEGDLIFDSL